MLRVRRSPSHRDLQHWQIQVERWPGHIEAARRWATAPVPAVTVAPPRPRSTLRLQCQPLAAAAHDSDSDVTGSPAATTVTQLIRLIITKCLYYLRNDTNRDDGAAKVT